MPCVTADATADRYNAIKGKQPLSMAEYSPMRRKNRADRYGRIS
jgi:hypothetical protein